MSNKGWHNESRRHSLAAKGVRTRGEVPIPRVLNGDKPMPLFVFSGPVLGMIREYNEISDGKEWIAEFDLVRGNVILNDVQFSDDVDASYLKWDGERDSAHNVGYVHYHPGNLVPKFTAQDFVLGCKLHGLRGGDTIHKMPYTLMGLVLPDRIVLIAIKPRAHRMEQFRECVASDGTPDTVQRLNNIVGEMQKRGEIVRFNDLSLWGERLGKSRGLVI